MPRTWRPPDNKPMTPLATVLWQYLRANNRGIYTPADLAREIGTWHNTILNWFNGRSVPGVVMLQRIHEVTGIPLQQLLDAAGGSRRTSAPPPQPAPRPAPPIEALVPPPSPQGLTPQQYAQSMQPVPSAFDEAVERIRHGWPHEAAEVMIKALYKTAGRDYWQVKIEEWKREEHDHDAIATLQMPAILPARTADADPSQADSQPAGRRS